MPATIRASLPTEFYDITNAKMLKTPLPTYVYARMMLTSLGIAAGLDIPENLANPGRAPTPNKGAEYMSMEELQLVLNKTPLFSETVAAEVDFSEKGTFGNVMRFNRPSFETTTYTLTSRTVAPNATISTTPIGVQGEQTALTLLRVAGPYDQTNSRVAPYAFENFDANMSIHKMVSIFGLSLQNDFHATLDGIGKALLDLGTAIYPGTASADSDFVSLTSYPMDVETILRAEATADSAKLPQFSDGFRIAVLHPQQVRQLKMDTDYLKASAFHRDYNVLFGEYVGTISKTHIFKSNNLTETTNGTVKVCKGHYIAPGVLLTGMGRPPQVRLASDDNYGETPKCIWLGDMAFGLADSRFVYTLRSATSNA